MANTKAKAAARAASHIGSLCIVSAIGFSESPHRSWVEKVSEHNTRVVASYPVSHQTLAVGLDSLGPVNPHRRHA
jgi:hypothetical protein